MSSWFMVGSVLLGVLGIVLAGVLLALYRKVYSVTLSKFSLVLVIFALAFTAQNALIIYSYLATMPLIPDTLSPFLFGIGACEATGLGAAVWVASR
jgi:hypothetical protein